MIFCVFQYCFASGSGDMLFLSFWEALGITNFKFLVGKVMILNNKNEGFHEQTCFFRNLNLKVGLGPLRVQFWEGSPNSVAL